MKSPVPYFGSKQTVAPWITSLLPDCGHYVEPYCGSLSVLLAKTPSPMETVNDLDGELMTFWRVLRDRPEELIRVCAFTPHSRAEMLAAHEPATDELEQARRVWVRLSQSIGGQLRKNGWRHHVNPSGSRFGMPPHLDTYVARMAAVAECKAAVVLSGYHSPLYDQLYDGWHVYEQATTTGNGKGDKGRTEVLWSNVPLGSQLDLFTAAATR